jgi:hypothetical protein
MSMEARRGGRGGDGVEDATAPLVVMGEMYRPPLALTEAEPRFRDCEAMPPMAERAMRMRSESSGNLTRGEDGAVFLITDNDYP